MFCRKFITAVTMFLCFVMSTQISYASKSVFVINEQDYSGVKAYRINGNQVELQATTYLPNEASGAISLAAWPAKSLMFITYDPSPKITWVSTKTLAEVGQYTEPNVYGSPYSDGFAGIVVDTTG